MYPKQSLPVVTMLRVRLRRKLEHNLTEAGVPPRRVRRAERRAHPAALDLQRRVDEAEKREKVELALALVNRVRQRRGSPRSSSSRRPTNHPLPWRPLQLADRWPDPDGLKLAGARAAHVPSD